MQQKVRILPLKNACFSKSGAIRKLQIRTWRYKGREKIFQFCHNNKVSGNTDVEKSWRYSKSLFNFSGEGNPLDPCLQVGQIKNKNVKKRIFKEIQNSNKRFIGYPSFQMVLFPLISSHLSIPLFQTLSKFLRGHPILHWGLKLNSKNSAGKCKKS